MLGRAVPGGVGPAAGGGRIAGRALPVGVKGRDGAAEDSGRDADAPAVALTPVRGWWAFLPPPCSAVSLFLTGPVPAPDTPATPATLSRFHPSARGSTKRPTHSSVPGNDTGPTASSHRVMHSISCAGASASLAWSRARRRAALAALSCAARSSLAVPAAGPVAGVDGSAAGDEGVGEPGASGAEGRLGPWYSRAGRGGSGACGEGKLSPGLRTTRAARGRACEGVGGWEKMSGRRWERCRWRVWTRE